MTHQPEPNYLEVNHQSPGDKLWDVPEIEEIVDKIWWMIPNANEKHKAEIRTLITDTVKMVEEQTLRNVPVGFVRQWINEDVKKSDYPLVTNADIQKYINIALTPDVSSNNE